MPSSPVSSSAPVAVSARGSDRLPKFIDAVREAAAKEFGVPVGSVKTKACEPKEWWDTSLGIPNPMEPTCSAQLSGYAIRVEVSGKEHTYHVASIGERICAPKRKPEAGETPVAPGGFLE